jgi:D-alanyl-D-alanine carboxypeptidase
MTAGRIAAHAAFAIAGAVVGAITVLAVSSWGRPAQTTTEPRGMPAVDAPRLSRPVELDDDAVILAWAPGGLPAGARREAEETAGVRGTTVVRAGLDWIVSTRAPDGSVIDRPGGRFRIPFEVAVVRPRMYARFAPGSERAAIRSLRRGEALLARTSAELRGADIGTTIKLVDRRLRVSGIVSDVATNGYEAIISGPPPPSWERVDNFMLLEADRDARARIDRRLRALLGPGRRLRTRIGGEQPFLRYGDAVHPQMTIKQRFGEFAARPLPDGTLEIDPRWRNDNIRTRHTPLLGSVTCHRALLPQLRSALAEIRRQGLGNLVQGYGGCYNPRFISRDPNGRLSHHAWGIAVDVNPASNRFGAEPNMPPSLVTIMESHGFTWGGRWLLPDGMHFEWSTFP